MPMQANASRRKPSRSTCGNFADFFATAPRHTQTGNGWKSTATAPTLRLAEHWTVEAQSGIWNS